MKYGRITLICTFKSYYYGIIQAGKNLWNSPIPSPALHRVRVDKVVQSFATQIRNTSKIGDRTTLLKTFSDFLICEQGFNMLQGL